MDLYLITGFLGAGKTTFLKNMIHAFQDKKIYLLVNEFGKEGVDGDLVRNLNTTLAEINNGSIFCACKIDKFEDELNKLPEYKPEVIIVEASGLSDPTNIKKILSKPEYNQINYKGSICIVDGARLQKVISTARVVPRQIKISTLILLNKIDLIDDTIKEKVKEEIFSLNPVATIQETTYGAFDPAWLSHLKTDIEIDEVMTTRDITLQKGSLTLANDIDLANLKGILNILGEGTYRVKGFVKIENKIYLANCVGGYVEVLLYEGSHSNLNNLVALAGTGMSLRKTFKEAQEIYKTQIMEVHYGSN